MKDEHLSQLLNRQAYIQQNMPKKDPFDAGIMRAVQAAKESLKLDKDQDDRALRNSILAFGDEMHKMPRTRGFIGNLAQVGRALGPAIKTHDAYEEDAKAKNMQMLQYAQALRAAEEAKIAKMEEEAYKREWNDKQLDLHKEQLEEQKKYHTLMTNIAKTKAEAKKGENAPFNPTELIEGKYVPFMNKKDRDPYNKKLVGANLVKTHIIDAQNILDKFNKEHKNEWLASPLIGSTMGKTRGIIGHFSGDKGTIKDANDRILLDQALGTIATKFEKDLKGGILTGDIVQRFQNMGLVPIRTDSPAVMASKLKQMKKITDEEQEIAEKSLMNNYHYIPSHVQEEQNSKAPSLLNEKILMKNPDTGDLMEISLEYKDKALEKGLMEIEE